MKPETELSLKTDLSKTLEEVIEHVGWLLRDFSFTIIDGAYDAESFGNSYVTLVSPAFRFRLIRDRGGISGEIASFSEPETWWDLYWVSEIIPVTNPSSFDLQSVAAFLRENFALLTEAFGSEYQRTKIELKRREEERKREGLRRFGK